MVTKHHFIIIMATVLFKVPKDPIEYKMWVEEVGIEVLKDYKPSKLPFIMERNGIRMKRNNCICGVVKRHSIAERDYYIIIMANNALSFNEIVCDYDPLFKHLCEAGDVENYYSIIKNK
jgi:hypothetical protein